MKGLDTADVLHLAIYRVVSMVTRTDIRMDSLSLRKRCLQRLAACVPDRASSGLWEEFAFLLGTSLW
jgi:hypothetical protein